jgi:hypothetical protein
VRTVKLGPFLLWAHKRVEACLRMQAKFDAARQATWKAGGIVAAPPSEEETEAHTELMTLLRVIARLKKAGVPELTPDHVRLLAEAGLEPGGAPTMVTAADMQRGRELEALGLAVMTYNKASDEWWLFDDREPRG